MLKLKHILAGLGLDELPEALLDQFRDAIEIKSAEKGGDLLGRGVCEAIDSAMEAKGIALDTRVAVGQSLAQNATAALMVATAAVQEYAKLQEAVVRAKATNDRALIQSAREARNTGADRVKAALANVVRAAGGQPQ